MRTRAFVVALMVGLLILDACGRAKPVSDVALKATVAPSLPAPVSVTRAAAHVADKAEPAEGVPLPARRKLIRNATVTLDVDSVESAVTALRAAAQSLGGYVGDESQSQEGVRGPRGSLTCRVPADRLDAMLARIRSIGRPRDVAVTAEDITEQYFDLEIRLRNQTRLEEQLLALLSRKGNDLGDLLNVERELARVRGEIDSLEGRRRYWDNQVAYSTVTITVEGPRPALAADEGGIWSSLGTAVTDAGENLVGFVAGFIATIGWLAPLVFVLMAGLWVLRRTWRFMRSRRVRVVTAP